MENNITLTPYAQWFLKHKGIEFTRNGNPVPKFVVWDLMKRGRYISVGELTKKAKPGWMDGKIIDVERYEFYLKFLQY